MTYADLSFKTLRKLYEIHMSMATECPESLSESDHNERHELALELDKRISKGDTQ